MTDALEELARLVPPPAEPAPPADWAAARAKLGLELPADYRALIDRYGAGTFDDELSVFAPGHPNEHLDLLRQADRQLWGLRYLRDQFGTELPFEPEPVAGGLIPWGVTLNGDVLHWHVTEPDDPAAWTVAVQEPRGPDWARFEQGAVEFLADVFSRRVAFPFSGDDAWPTEAPRFVRAE